MKFKGPENITSVSVGGECFNVGDDGLVETPDNGNYASLLAPHGFEQVAEPAPEVKAPKAASKQAKVAAEPAPEVKAPKAASKQAKVAAEPAPEVKAAE